MPRQRILLVEDESRILSGLELVLTHAGYHVAPASNGSEALKKVKQMKYEGLTVDILITDIQIPGISVFQLINKLYDMNIDPRIVAISGFFDTQIKNKISQYGCVAFLPKPFKPCELLECLKHLPSPSPTFCI